MTPVHNLPSEYDNTEWQKGVKAGYRILAAKEAKKKKEQKKKS